MTSKGAAQAVSVRDSILSTPAISGGRVVFSYAGDLFVAAIEDGSPARRLTSDRGTETSPRISPDGKTVAFLGSYEGGSEVFTIPIDGGEPTRLTYEAGGKTLIGWTPDGRSIAYGTAARNFTNRQPALYYVPAAGGPAKATVIKEIGEGSFLPDGRLLYVRQNSVNFNWRRYRGGSQGKLSIYDFRNNSYRELPAKREQNFTPIALGNDSAIFLSDRENGTLNLYRTDLKSGRAERLTNSTDVDIRTPATDGKTVVYELEGRLMLMDLATKKVRPFAPVIRSENLAARPTFKNLAAGIEGATTNDAGTRAYVAARGEIFAVSTKTGDTQNLTNSSGARDRAPLLSPDNKSLYYLSDRTTGSGPGEYDVYVRDLASGKERALSISRLKPTGMTLSADGKFLAVSNNAAALYLVDTASGSVRQLPKGVMGIRAYAFSPDSKVIAAIRMGTNDFGRVVLFPVAEGAQGLPYNGREITEGRFDDQDVDFSLDGKFLYLLSLRAPAPTFGQYEFSLKVQDATRLYILPLAASTPNPLVDRDEDLEVAAPKPPTPPPVTPPATPPGTPPAPTTPPATPPATNVPPVPPTIPTAPVTPAKFDYDLDGAEQRLLPLPIPAGTYGGLTAVPGGLIYVAGGLLYRFDLASRASAPVTGLRGGFTLSPRRNKIAFAGPGFVQVSDLRPGLAPGTGAVDLGGLQARIDPKAEWRQIFWETWRFQRDTFYDPTFGGQNWRAIGDRYSRFAERAESRNDLTIVLRRLVGELGTSHAYVQGAGDQGGSTGPGVAYLGADYEVRGGKVTFARIFRGENADPVEAGPLGGPATGVKEGDALIAVDGVPVDPNTDPGQFLLGKAGRVVTLTVQTGSGLERRVQVVPTGSEYRLRYSDWVERNRRAVEAASGGRIGYFHVSDTAAQGSIDFVKGFYSQTDKEAVIVDERWNGGGYIQPWFVDTLARKSRAYIAQPNFPVRPEAVAISGPKVMLINGYAGSGGDFFPYLFRQSKLGPLVGERTWGGLVGIGQGLITVDGQSVTSPGFAIFDADTEEIIAENQGIEPDVQVDLRPDLLAQGRDPQLEKGIEILLAELKKLPPRKPFPAVPRLGRNGRLGG